MNDSAWEMQFPHLKPITAPPTLFSINGCGVILYGRRDYDSQTNTYLKTRWFTLIFLPLIALGSYRVADAPGGGWYFLGKEPLALLPKVWNWVLLLALLTTGGFIGWHSYTTSPEYLAAQEMKDADEHLAKGEHAEAVRSYRDVLGKSTSHSPAATEKVVAIARGEHEMSLSQAATVFAELKAWPSRPQAVQNLVALAMQWVEKKGKADPQGALALLSSVESMLPRAQDFHQACLPYLQALVDKGQNDLETVNRLALGYESKGDLKKCKSLLAPHEKSLGTTEGARILGQILVREGQIERASKLLLPYIKKNVNKLQQAQAKYAKLQQETYQKAIREAKMGSLPQKINMQLQQTNDRAEQQKIFIGYVTSLLNKNPRYAEAELRVRRASALVSAVLMLGVQRLQKAQSLTDVDQKQAELKKAESIFLSIKDVASQRTEHKLLLGQVYYWLGKEKQGEGLLNDALKQSHRNPESLLQVAQVYRSLGQESNGRKLCEEAYKKATPKALKERIALTRSLMALDLKETILWLKRAGDHLSVTASLHQAQAEQAFQEGKRAVAEKEVQQAIDLYAKMTSDATVSNNSMICYQLLYRLTGDTKTLTEALKRIEKAHELIRSDSIVLHNYLRALIAAVVREVTKKTINHSLLRSIGSLSQLRYLYSTPKERDQVFVLLEKHPDHKRAKEKLNQLIVLAPKNPHGFLTLYELLSWQKDLKPIRQLVKRAETANIDLSGLKQQYDDFYSKKKDPKQIRRLRATIKEREQIIQQARKSKQKVSFAIAVGEWIRSQRSLALRGESIDRNRTVKLAEEAHQLAPSRETQSVLIGSLLERAADSLAGQVVAIRDLKKRGDRRFSTESLMALALAESEATRKAILKNPDAHRALTLVKAQYRAFPSAPSVWQWKMLSHTDPTLAKTVAQALAKDEKGKLSRRINQLLMPLTLEGGLRMIWYYESQGMKKEINAMVEALKKERIPLPIREK